MSDPDAKAVAALAEASDTSAALAEMLLDQLRADDPELARLVCLAAVARKFDAALLASVTDQDQRDPDFVRRFDALLAMPFVTPRRDGRCRLHSEIRRSLLRRLMATDEDRRLARSLNVGLADHYDDQHRRARQLIGQLAEVDDLLREVSPGRLADIRASCEKQLVRPLIEAQHHRTVVDVVGTTLTDFSSSFSLYEDEGRLGICRLLLNAWRTDVQHLLEGDGPPIGWAEEGGTVARGVDDIPPSDDPRNWGIYYEARLVNDEGNQPEARAIVQRLVDDPRIDGQLRLWSVGLVSQTLIDELRLREALDATEREAAAHDDADLDAWNLPVVQLRRAIVERMLWDFDEARASLETALEAVRAVGNAGLEVTILGDLAGLEGEQGDLARAAQHAVQALHRSRRLLAPDAEPAARRIAVQFVETFGRIDPRLGDTFHAEATNLTRGDVRERRFSDVSYVSALSGSRQFERAHAVMDDLLTLVGGERAGDVSGLLMTEANLLDDEGRESEAVERNHRIIDEIEVRRGEQWNLAAALTNAATIEMTMGDQLDEALASARRARELWQQIGHLRGVTAASLVEAEVRRRRADYDAARVELDPMPPSHRAVRYHWYVVSALLEIDLGRFADAARHLDTAVTEYADNRRFHEAARLASRLVGVQLRAGDVAAAERTVDRLTELMGGLHDLLSYRPLADHELGDEHNARAVRQLVVASRHPLDNLRSSVEHLDEAMSHDPASCWYPLNLAYAHLRLGESGAADKALGRARTLAAGSLFEKPIAALTFDAD